MVQVDFGSKVMRAVSYYLGIVLVAGGLYYSIGCYAIKIKYCTAENVCSSVYSKREYSNGFKFTMTPNGPMLDTTGSKVSTGHSPTEIAAANAMGAVTNIAAGIVQDRLNRPASMVSASLTREQLIQMLRADPSLADEAFRSN